MQIYQVYMKNELYWKGLSNIKINKVNAGFQADKYIVVEK